MRLGHVSAPYLLGLPSWPGIDPHEHALLRDFLRDCQEARCTYSVNVPVGPGDTTTRSLGAAIDRMWTAITRPRMDLVIEGPRVTTIVEAKVHARFRAVTQVLRYVELYRREYPRLGVVRPMIVCRSHAPGVDRLLEAKGGVLLVVWPLPSREDVRA